MAYLHGVMVSAAERRRFYAALQELIRIYQFRDRDGACYGDGSGDVSPDECYALEAIEAAGQLRVGDLASALNLHKSNASRLAVTLEAKGYVARVRDRDDGRALVLRITKRGRRVHDAIRARVEDIHAAILGAYPPAARKAFVQLLGDLAAEARIRVGGAGGCAGDTGRAASAARGKSARKRKGEGACC
jgi:DNA-binding MarR family transcriptional regulator